MEPPEQAKTGPGAALDRLLVELDRLLVEEYDVGSRLPSEGALAEQFGVSRITVREAMKVMAGRDLVDLSAGRRAVVKGPTSSTLARHLDVLLRRDGELVFEVLDVRLTLEVQAATLAARRATPEELAALTAVVDEMEHGAAEYAATGDGDAYNRADVRFHETLAGISGNRVLAMLLTSLEDALHESFARSFAGSVRLGRPLQSGLDAHRLLADKVAAHDTRGAAAAMRGILQASAGDLRAARSHPAHPH